MLFHDGICYPWCGPTRLLCPRGSPGKNPRVGRQSILQGIFPTQGLNPGLLLWEAYSWPSEPPERPYFSPFLILNSIFLIIFFLILNSILTFLFSAFLTMPLMFSCKFRLWLILPFTRVRLQMFIYFQEDLWVIYFPCLCTVKKKSLFQLVFTWVTFPEVCVLWPSPLEKKGTCKSC